HRRLAAGARRGWRRHPAVVRRRQDQIRPAETQQAEVAGCPMRTPVLIAALVATALCAACGPPRIVLPTGQSAPLADFGAPLAAAGTHCAHITTFTAELSLSGQVGSERLRGRVLAGFGPGALRLEALAPGGSPAFILA